NAAVLSSIGAVNVPLTVATELPEQSALQSDDKDSSQAVTEQTKEKQPSTESQEKEIATKSTGKPASAPSSAATPSKHNTTTVTTQQQSTQSKTQKQPRAKKSLVDDPKFNNFPVPNANLIPMIDSDDDDVTPQAKQSTKAVNSKSPAKLKQS